MPETLSIVAKVPPGSYPHRNVIKKRTLQKGFRVVYRDIFLLKILLRIELVTGNRKVFITALSKGWKIPEITGHLNVEYLPSLSFPTLPKPSLELMSTKG